MLTEIVMPKLGKSVVEGTLSKQMINEGVSVQHTPTVFGAPRQSDVEARYPDAS